MVSVFEFKVTWEYTKTLYIVGTKCETDFILGLFPNYEKVQIQLAHNFAYNLSDRTIESLEDFVGTGHAKYIFLYDMTDNFCVDYFKRHCRSIESVVTYRNWKIDKSLM